MNEFYKSINKSLIIASVVAFIISFFTSGNISFGSVLSGLSVLILAISMILLMLFTQIKDFYKLITSTGPFLIMFGVIGLLMFLIITNKTAIIDNHVSQNYYTFSNIIILLLLLQLYIIHLNVNNNTNTYLLYLFGVLSSICSVILYIILTYYKTDG
jgi:hypothetical protein